MDLVLDNRDTNAINVSHANPHCYLTWVKKNRSRIEFTYKGWGIVTLKEVQRSLRVVLSGPER